MCSYLLAHWLCLRNYSETSLVCWHSMSNHVWRKCLMTFLNVINRDGDNNNRDSGERWFESLILPALCSSTLSTSNNYVIHLNDSESTFHKKKNVVPEDTARSNPIKDPFGIFDISGGCRRSSIVYYVEIGFLRRSNLWLHTYLVAEGFLFLLIPP